MEIRDPAQDVEADKMQKYMLLGLLGLCTWEDVRKREVTVIYILLFGIAGVVMHLFFPICSIYSVLWGGLLGVVMMIVSAVSRGNIGMGDGILLVVTGVYLGGSDNLELFLTGLLLAAVWSLGLFVFKKKRGNDEIAFIPFLLISYFIMLIRWQL